MKFRFTVATMVVVLGAWWAWTALSPHDKQSVPTPQRHAPAHARNRNRSASDLASQAVVIESGEVNSRAIEGRGYPWSSLRHYPKGNAPERQPLDRVLDAFKLNHERRGRVAYVSWLETRAVAEGGKIGEKAMEAIGIGWYLGEEGFKDKLLGLIDKAGAKVTKRGSVAGAAIRAHGEGEAERIIRVCGAALGLPENMAELRSLQKGDPGKVICAALVKANTSMSNEWLAARLCMGHPAAICQLVSRTRKDLKIQKILKKHEKTFKPRTDPV